MIRIFSTILLLLTLTASAVSFVTPKPFATPGITLIGKGKIDLNGATDVSAAASLPAGALPPGTVPVTKSLFIDLLDPDFNLIPTIPEKIEGLAWGQDLPDGRHVLYVISDNDLNPNLATQIYSFAIDSSLISLEEQLLPGPFYPPGQVKKILGEKYKKEK